MDEGRDSIVLHPIFLKCCRYITDKFWDRIFKQMSYGIMPYNCFVKSNVLYTKGKLGDKKCILDSSNIEKTFNEIYNDLKKNMGIYSPIEKLENDIEFKKIHIEEYKNWCDIKKKNKKDLLIELFCVYKMKQYNLNLKETENLIFFIKSALNFKTIKPADISIENNLISGIKGINFYDKKIELDMDLYDFEVDDTESLHNKGKKYLIDLWEKYLSQI